VNRRGENLKSGYETQAACDFLETIAVAQRFGSKTYALRATANRARLLAKQGHRAMLAEIYGWFWEGFDIPPEGSQGAAR
jgi:hypothetical protein